MTTISTRRLATLLLRTRSGNILSSHISPRFVPRGSCMLSTARFLSSFADFKASGHSDRDLVENVHQDGSQSSNLENLTSTPGIDPAQTTDYADNTRNQTDTVPRDGRELFRELFGVNNATIRDTGLGGFGVATSSAFPTMTGAEGTRFLSAASTATAAAGGMSSIGNSPTLSGRRLRNRMGMQQQQPTGGNATATGTGNTASSLNHVGLATNINHPESGIRQRQSALHRYIPDIAARVPVTSIYAARHIDVVGVLSKVFGKMNVLQHRFGRNGLTVQFPPASLKAPNDSNTDAKKEEQDLDGSAFSAVEETLLPRYIVVFRFGAVVFFNFTNREARAILEDIKGRPDCCVDPIPNGFEQRERFDIAISPGLEEPDAIVTGDVATIKMLDLNNVAVISTIMGQTVALDSYNVIVDELLATFATINANVKRTGNFTSMDRDALFKVIAQNNSLFIDMVSKLGLKDRSDTAWNFTQYDAVYQGMREEFLIDNRFDDTEFKLNLIQQNTKFFLEVMHQNKTNFLEWIIIGLITLECGLMCLEMSGMGQLLFESLGVTEVVTTESIAPAKHT